jgi:hypothetical protein
MVNSPENNEAYEPILDIYLRFWGFIFDFGDLSSIFRFYLLLDKNRQKD